MTKFALVGDVGGTNARLALCDIASGRFPALKLIPGSIIQALRPLYASISTNKP